MLIIATWIAIAVFIASLPYWIPNAMIALRMRIFTRVNGEEWLGIPGNVVDASLFKQVYSHPAANGRSKGAALSDLFWYWLSPGPEIHQEHLEPGEKYEEVARTTRRILALSKGDAEELVARYTVRAMDSLGASPVNVVRLRDIMMPIWADFYYEVVFGESCPPAVRDLIVGNANDVVTALKGCGLRHMGKRTRLTRFLIYKLRTNGIPHTLPARLSIEDQAFYLQGVFFNTAVVQMSEAMVHLLMAVAQYPEVQAKLARDLGDEAYLDKVIKETMRLYPLFGIAHRITSADITLDRGATIREGTVLCFDYPAYHRTGFDQPERFDPDRWTNISPREAHYIPFGVAANRPCPASGLAPLTMQVAAREILKRFMVSSSASHTRSIPNRGPCLLIRRSVGRDPKPPRRLLLYMLVRDRWEDVWRSFVQLFLGTYMVWDARRLRLCGRIFEAQEKREHIAGVAPARVRERACPIRGK
jgi:Cytochrome P450